MLGRGAGIEVCLGERFGADEFVNLIVDSYGELAPRTNGQFYLYGHSAGGQFVSRYAVMHPERLLGSVISAAGTFAFPNPNVPWTNGMGRLQRKMQWSGSDRVQNH